MLSYILSAAIAAAVGTAGGFIGARASRNNIRRGLVGLQHSIDRSNDRYGDELQLLKGQLRDRPTQESLQPLLAAVQTLGAGQGELANLARGTGQDLQSLAAAAVTRDELRPVLAQVIVREELDMALQAVVAGISQNAGLPLPPAPPAAQAAGLPPMFRAATGAAAQQEQLAGLLSDMSERMAAINQQLGIG